MTPLRTRRQMTRDMRHVAFSAPAPGAASAAHSALVAPLPMPAQSLRLHGDGRSGDPVYHLPAGLAAVQVLCIYGTQEASASLRTLPGLRFAQRVARPGGHYFDGRYELLAQTLPASIRDTRRGPR